jgi:multiple sugar transport system substrate-binding protein
VNRGRSLAWPDQAADSQRSKHADEAWKFLAWLNDHKNDNGVTGMGQYLADMGLIPPRTADAATLKKPLSDPNLAPIYDAATYAMPEPTCRAPMRRRPHCTTRS